MVLMLAGVRWEWMLLLTRDGTSHMRKVRLSRASERKQTAELLRLIGGLLVRIRVLLETLDAVLQFWTSETREEDARVVARDVHHCWVESEVTVLREHARLEY
jgi:hypothetical protein